MRAYRRSSERGAGLVEYALIMVLIAVVVISVLAVTGSRVATIYCDVTTKLTGQRPKTQACNAPLVTFDVVNGTAGDVQVRAIVEDSKGLTNITNVRFYFDGAIENLETQDWYCLGSGDGPCANWPAVGTHTVRAVATNADGYQGEATFTFTAPLP